MLIKYRVEVCIMGVIYNKVCDLVEYDWCRIFFRKKGGRPACVNVCRCAT